MCSSLSAERKFPILPKATLPLGFGTGMLYAASDRPSALRLLETAFDSGIVYFDTARFYSDGLSEGMLGQVFSHRRDQVILVSKAGILPPMRSLSKRIADKAVHTARKVPLARRFISEPTYPGPTFHVFDIPRLRKSVETSLRELKTDYLDALLLHEPTAETAGDSAIKAFAEQLVKEGKIRAYGVAPAIEDALAIEQRGIVFGTIMQFASSAWDDNIAHFSARDGRLLITHSIFTTRLRDTLARLREDDAAAARWRAAFGVEPTDAQAMASLLLRHAVARNPGGMVLFSTTSPDRIRQNLRAADTPLSPPQAALLSEMLMAL